MRTILLISTLIFSVNLFAEYYKDVKVLRVIDGDTVYVKHSEKLLKLRLLNIDAPELKQPFGEESRTYLKSLIGSKLVDVNTLKKDRYERVLSTIFFEGKNVNKLMVEKGLAWVYDDYVIDKSLYEDQKHAKKNNIGLWSDSNSIPPWLWRKKITIK